MTRALRRLMTKTATTKAKPAASGGKVADRAASLSDVVCTPPDDVSQRGDIIMRYGTQAGTLIKECFTLASYDIRAGDSITIDSTEYNVLGMARYDGPSFAPSGEAFRALHLEQVGGINR